MMARHYIMVVADIYGPWRKATAPALVRDGGIPPKTAAKWAEIRRSMSPAGLKKKALVNRN